MFKIKTSELFLKLKHDIKPYQSKITHDKGLVKAENNVQSSISKYNREIYNEITCSSFKWADHEVDEKTLNEFGKDLDHYFDLYAPNNEEFREFIRLISLYLIFIAKKPLHPPGITFSNNTTVFKRAESYYCTGKAIFLKDNRSLCKYCIAKIKK